MVFWTSNKSEKNGSVERNVVTEVNNGREFKARCNCITSTPYSVLSTLLFMISKSDFLVDLDHIEKV